MNSYSAMNPYPGAESIELIGGPGDGERVAMHDGMNARFHYKGWWYQYSAPSRALAVEPKERR
jgi:hypothetical protein